MPRLSHPRITKGDAISALLDVYRNEPNFVKELDNIRQPYTALIGKLAADLLVFWTKGDISPREYYSAVLDYYKGKSNRDPFPAEQFPYLGELQPYLDSLGDLAHKWKLRAPWAVLVLHYFDILDWWKAEGLPTEADIPLETFDSLYPWKPPADPLTITVPAWALILLGRAKVLTEIANRLRHYENELKASGLGEYPSRLKRHAQWWFEHYVNGKTYDEIAQLEAYTPSGSLISYAKNVGAAVRRFSKLIGITPSALK